MANAYFRRSKLEWTSCRDARDIHLLQPLTSTDDAEAHGHSELSPPELPPGGDHGDRGLVEAFAATGHDVFT
eukprot:8024200-Pyramimonas_sp.AAC.1